MWSGYSLKVEPTGLADRWDGGMWEEEELKDCFWPVTLESSAAICWGEEDGRGEGVAVGPVFQLGT